MLLATNSDLSGAPALKLENAWLSATVTPAAGGAIRRLHYRNAFTFPLIAGRGAGVAGCGRLFAPRIEVNGVPADWSDVRVEHADAGEIVLSASFPAIAPKLGWRRRMSLEPDGTEIAIDEELRNAGDRPVPVRIGGASRQEAEPWRDTDRSWIGNATACEPQHVPVTRQATNSVSFERGTLPDLSPDRVEISGRRLFWRQIEQYGTGVLYRLDLPEAGTMTSVDLPEPGSPREVTWRSPEMLVPAHGSLRWHAVVSVDEGGGKPDQDNAFAPVLARSDFAAAGRTGEQLIGFATVVSPRPRKVRVTVLTDHELAAADFSLVPGKVARLPVAFKPGSKGELPVQVTVSEAGRTIASATSQVLIDGSPDNPVWRRFTRRMPEDHYQGTWEQIGAEIVKNPHPIGAPTSFAFAVAGPGASAADYAFQSSHFPFVASMIEGAAHALGVPPSRIAIVQRSEPDPAPASFCMDVACYGPDGPINAFSKERDGPYFHGLGYVKVLPSEGYRFHMYMHQGINSAGLSITGADLNVDQRTQRLANEHLAAWLRGGRHVLDYQTVGKWLLLARCANVEQALALISDPEAPLAFSGNMLLVDRDGHAARVESMGIDRKIYPAADPRHGFFVAGNYPHEWPDGRFQIGNWHWAANTMLREQYLRAYEGARQGQLDLTAVMELMQSHEAGGMCQHLFDNPGQLYTTASFIAVCRTGDLYLAEGPPCEVQYVRHTLSP